MDGGIIWTLLYRGTEGPNVLFMRKYLMNLEFYRLCGEMQTNQQCERIYIKSWPSRGQQKYCLLSHCFGGSFCVISLVTLVQGEFHFSCSCSFYFLLWLHVSTRTHIPFHWTGFFYLDLIINTNRKPWGSSKFEHWSCQSRVSLLISISPVSVWPEALSN